MQKPVRTLTTKDATDVMEQFRIGDLVFDLETGLYYCKKENRFSILVDEELSPCLGSQCDKSKYCFKYNLAQKFSVDNFIIRDLSVETERVYDDFENYRGTYTCCSKDNRYRYFRWDEV